MHWHSVCTHSNMMSLSVSGEQGQCYTQCFAQHTWHSACTTVRCLCVSLQSSGSDATQCVCAACISHLMFLFLQVISAYKYDTHASLIPLSLEPLPCSSKFECVPGLQVPVPC
jgi:hypothetical protein